MVAAIACGNLEKSGYVLCCSLCNVARFPIEEMTGGDDSMMGLTLMLKKCHYEWCKVCMKNVSGLGL